MSPQQGDPLRRLTTLLSRLPGIGEKSALRLALAILRSDKEYPVALANALLEMHAQMRLCSLCSDLSTQKICERCLDPKRDHSVICVIAQPQDRMAIERSGAFRGLYHVLHGVLDPLSGIGPRELKIDTLLRRLEHSNQDSPILEIIVATSPNVEGDATALYLSKLISPLKIKVSRIASGVAVGGELEYADLTTINRALEDRRLL